MKLGGRVRPSLRETTDASSKLLSDLEGSWVSYRDQAHTRLIAEFDHLPFLLPVK